MDVMFFVSCRRLWTFRKYSENSLSGEQNYKRRQNDTNPIFGDEILVNICRFYVIFLLVIFLYT